jgi:hypothetical protein
MYRSQAMSERKDRQVWGEGNEKNGWEIVKGKKQLSEASIQIPIEYQMEK